MADGSVTSRANASPYRSDPALVQACVAGSQDAWEEIVERYGRLVYSIPRRYGLSPDDADDVFQNVFIVLCRRLSDLRDQTRLSSWLITTTHRECWRLGKLSAKQTGLAEDAPIVDVSAPPVDEVVRWEREQQVHEALRGLDERCRALLSALFLEPDTPSYEEIGRRFSLPVGSIGPTRARCFRKMEAALIDLGFDSGT